MFSVNITGDLSDSRSYIRNLTAVLTDGLALHKLTGKIVKERTLADIERGGSDAGPFKPTDPRMAEIEGKGHTRPLIWKGKFGKSFQALASDTGVAVGSSLPYARKLREGGRNRAHSAEFRKAGVKVVNMWPRPFLGLYRRDVIDLLHAIFTRARRGVKL